MRKDKIPGYRSWTSMLERCRRTTRHNYARYGGRGISVCERWHSFDNFLADMGERPEGMTLDRIDNLKDYEPANCRWATRSEQSRNRVYPANRKEGARGPRYKDRTGQRINGLTFLDYVRSTDDTSYWKARCDCGTKLLVSSRNVVRGYKRSCGCGAPF